ncbi:MAG TPA: hypothetical protein PLI95_13275 [Polyangiaceae bacterium]|nr:hypothetical protein [Polyangiaceae bacterium]
MASRTCRRREGEGSLYSSTPHCLANHVGNVTTHGSALGFLAPQGGVWDAGTLFDDPMEFMVRPASIVAPPRLPLTRHHGVQATMMLLAVITKRGVIERILTHVKVPREPVEGDEPAALLLPLGERRLTGREKAMAVYELDTA